MTVKFIALLKITFLQLALILILFAFKYFLNYYNLFVSIKKPFIWFTVFVSLIFISAAGVSGIIENSGHSIDDLKINPNKTLKDKLIILIVEWGIRIPIYMSAILFLILFIPTSLFMFVFLAVGLLLNNSISVFSNKQEALK